MSLAEAWPGYSPSNRGNPVHVVDWPPGRVDGHALCGRELERVVLFADGWARYVGVTRCTKCDQRAAERNEGPMAEVIPLTDVVLRRRRGR